MKFKLTTALLAFSFVSFLASSVILAGSLKLTKIGALDLGGKTYPEWWYTAINPTLYGEATTSSALTVAYGDKSGTATADSAGKWSFVLPLDKGDYDIKITSGSDSYAFKLHLGQSLPDSTSETTQSTGGADSEVPSTGVEQTVALGLGIGVSLLALYFYLYGHKDSKLTFEEQINS